MNTEIQHIREANVLEVYVRDGCPHCAKAKEFLLKFGSERPWLDIIYRSVDHDPTARNDLMQYSNLAGTFVLVSGAVYYVFVAAWPNELLLIGISIALRWTLGGLALAIGGFNINDFFIWKWSFSLSIPDSAKSYLSIIKGNEFRI